MDDPSEWELADERLERNLRLAAIPAALILARIVLALPGGHFLSRVFFSMWIHETGHAVCAWLCGFMAFPGPWFTPISAERSLTFSLLVTAAIATAIWNTRGLTRTALCGLAFVQLVCTFVLRDASARQLFIFGGDAGCLVLGSVLMSTVYVSGQIKRDWLRWGFLVIGAASFMDVFEQWWGARHDPDRIPFGMNEGRGLSDASVLSDQFGWSASQLVGRYVALGVLCLVALAVVYALNLRRRALPLIAE